MSFSCIDFTLQGSGKSTRQKPSVMVIVLQIPTDIRESVIYIPPNHTSQHPFPPQHARTPNQSKVPAIPVPKEPNARRLSSFLGEPTPRVSRHVYDVAPQLKRYIPARLFLDPVPYRLGVYVSTVQCMSKKNKSPFPNPVVIERMGMRDRSVGSR